MPFGSLKHASGVKRSGWDAVFRHQVDQRMPLEDSNGKFKLVRFQHDLNIIVVTNTIDTAAN